MSMLRRIVWPALLLAVALATGCAHAPPAATSVALLQPLPGLYTAGQPAASDWAAIKARGVRTVVNLRAPGELKDRDEAAEVRAAGLRYVEIPVSGAEGINPANARALHEALAPAHGGGVLVHCASGNRAGALLALEQREGDGVAAQRALDIGKSGGVTGLEGRLRQALGIQE
ncbi:protein tyrosine phosphatase family protein [Thermomonas sp. LB-4]|uniref:protein tyrosine phosphatase family protein n=1 Tax=Thermomonas sp. LB-4 TaxID=3102790 RepID=UPI002ED96B1C